MMIWRNLFMHISYDKFDDNQLAYWAAAKFPKGCLKATATPVPSAIIKQLKKELWISSECTINGHTLTWKLDCNSQADRLIDRLLKLEKAYKNHQLTYII